MLRTKWMVTALLVSLGWAVTQSTAASAAMQWKVTASNTQQLDLILDVQGARLVEAGTDASGRAWHRVELEGAHQTGEDGLPLIPRVARWLALPPTGDARIEVRVLERQFLGAARLKPHPTAEIDPDAMEDEPRLVERVIESPQYRAYRSAEAEVVRLGAPVFQRRQRMAPLQVSPVFYDAATGRIEVATKIAVTIRFPRSREISDEVGAMAPALRSGLLNADVAGQWACLDPRQAERKQSWAEGPSIQRLRKAAGTPLFDKAALQGPEIRLRTAETGLHRVLLSTLINEHQFPASTLRKNVRLYQKRRSNPNSADYPTPLTADVPLHFVGNPDENLPVDPSDIVVFYGFSAQDDWDPRTVDGENFPSALEAPTRPDHYNSSNVYWLAAMDPGSGSWARMATQTLGRSQGNNEPHFRRQKTFTGDAAYQDNVLNPQLERFHWSDWLDVDVQRAIPLFSAVQDSSVRLKWTVTSRVTRSGNAQLVDFYLDSDKGRVPLHSINSDLSIYRTLWEENQTIPANLLADGFVRLGMERFSNGSSSFVGTYLGSISVDYASEYRAAFSDIEFTAGRSGADVDLLVRGFDRGDLLLFDVTDPHAPMAIDASANVDALGDGTFDLSLHVPQAPGQLREFRAAPLIRLDILRNQDVESDTTPTVLDVANDLQVLAIGPAIFAPTMQSWVQWRTDHDLGYGWNVGYVDVQQIYDDFSGGLQSPQAIHDFVEYAYTVWGAQALLLVGDANEDAREVSSDAGPNLVPPSLHLQSFSQIFELLASDKWYGYMNPGANYPFGIQKTSDLIVGRLPASDAAGLQVMLDKIYAYEQPSAADTWRAQSYWIADDAYSSQYLGAAQGAYGLQGVEMEFGFSQDRIARTASASLDSVQTGLYYNIDEVTAGCRNDLNCVTPGCVAQCFDTRGRTRLLEVLDQGWLMVSYQGHAAFNKLAHEDMLNLNSNELGALNNPGRPFLFFGMGCHVSDFLQSKEGRVGPPIGEWLLEQPQRGSIATYGSSGFEFLYPNAAFMEEIGSTFFDDGRSSGMVGGSLRSQWVLGEVIAQAELNLLGTPGVSKKDQMVSQYNLLGDPLLRMDALPPRLKMSQGGAAVSDGSDLVADAGGNVAMLSIEGIDETGISHLDIVDSKGRDSSGLVQLLSGSDPRRQQMTLALPILPQTYDIDVALFDGAYPERRPTTRTLHVRLLTQFTVDGVPFDPSAGVGFPVGRNLPVQLEITSPVDLSSTDIGAVSLVGGTVGSVTATGSGRQWTLAFDVTAESETGQALQLQLAGITEEIPLSAGPGGGGALAIEQHYPYPNPARLAGGGSISVVARASEAVQWARLTVYDLSGHLVFERRDESLSLSGSDFALTWDGRSPDGEEVANGTYFYRLEAGAGTRTAKSDMGRIVVMR